MTCHSKFLYNEEDHYKNHIKYKVAKKIQEMLKIETDIIIESSPEIESFKGPF